MTIVYRAGAENANADGLSQQAWPDTNEKDSSNKTSPPVLVKGERSSVMRDVRVTVPHYERKNRVTQRNENTHK